MLTCDVAYVRSELRRRGTVCVTVRGESSLLSATSDAARWDSTVGPATERCGRYGSRYQLRLRNYYT